VDGKEGIVSYIERVELYFAANYVKAFLALIRADAYGVLRNLLAPGCLKGKSFVELKKELMISPYSPKTILIAKCFKCHSPNQHESETVTQFIGELKQLALRCEFGTFLEEA